MVIKYYTRVLLFCVFIFLIIGCSSSKEKLKLAAWNDNYNKGEHLFDEGKIDEALTYLENAYNTKIKSKKKRNLCLGETAYLLAIVHQEIGDFSEANNYYLEAINLLKIQGVNYYYILYRIGLNYREIGDFDNSIHYLKKTLRELHNTNNTKSDLRIEILNQISTDFKSKEDFHNAVKYNKLSTNIIEELYGNTSPYYSKNLSYLSQIYFAWGKYSEAFPIQKYAISLFPNKVRDTSYNYALSIYTLSLLYKGTNEYHKEIKLLNEFKQIMGKTPSYHRYLIDANNNLAVAYDNLGDYENAITTIKEVIAKTSRNDKNYPVRLQNLAYYYANLGVYNKALEIYEKAKLTCENFYGRHHSKYAQLLDAIGQLYLKKGDLKKAKVQFKEAISIYENTKGFNRYSKEYGFYLNNYARTLLNLKEYDNAIAILNKSIKISESDSIIDKSRYYRKKHDLARVFIAQKKYSEAIDVLIKYKDDYELKIGDKHIDYGKYLKDLGKAYIKKQEYKKAMPYLDASNSIIVSQIDKVFKFRSEKENKDFIKTIIPEFDEYQSFLINQNNPNGLLIEMNLNNQLVLKNLLLNQSRQIINKLANSEDSLSKKLVYDYKDLKSQINNQYNLSYAVDGFQVDSLKKILNDKEVELVKIYNKKYPNSSSLIENWKSSQQKLKNNEIAIEFSNFTLSNSSNTKDSIIYVAYIYKKDWNTPKVIKLFEEKQLLTLINKKSLKQLYATRGSKARGVSNYGNIYDLVWKPLTSYLNDITTIYYSPSGILNQIPFSAIPINKNQKMVDKFNLIQLSSTNSINELKKELLPDNILFFGGIDYSYSPENKVLDSTIINYKNLEIFKSSNSSIGSVTTWKYLPESLTEINNIKDIFHKNNIYSKSLTGKNASEEEFKRLDRNSPKIIHIASHGFFYENIDKTVINSSIYTYAEDPLLRSGLILAGGNYAWEYGVNPYEKEDGILTALEISNLDLSNTDLVVLSACETGLGDIDGSEGVYGLQRAFKMAGVDFLIMSLWEVPDKETAEFMELFYNKWFNGTTIQNAFNQTQRLMSNKYKGEPEKWAAFVLLE